MNMHPFFYSNFSDVFDMTSICHVALDLNHNEIVDVEAIEIKELAITDPARLLPTVRHKKNHVMRCHCTVCGREFHYGDDASPMFKDDAWNFILSFYGINERARAETAGLKFFENIEDGHTYICAKCAERALDRPIRITDLKGCWFNVPFLKSNFGYSDEQASYFILS